MDEWFGLSMNDIRQIEEKTQIDLKEKIVQQKATSSGVHHST